MRYPHCLCSTVNIASLGIPALAIWFWGLDILMWHRARINHVFIFTFDPNTALRYQDVLTVRLATARARCGVVLKCVFRTWSHRAMSFLSCHPWCSMAAFMFIRPCQNAFNVVCDA